MIFLDLNFEVFVYIGKGFFTLIFFTFESGLFTFIIVCLLLKVIVHFWDSLFKFMMNCLHSQLVFYIEKGLFSFIIVFAFESICLLFMIVHSQCYFAN